MTASPSSPPHARPGSSTTFQATRAALFPGLTAAYRGMLVGAACIVAASFLVRATPRITSPARLTFGPEGAPVLELLEALPDAVASRDAVFVTSDLPERCEWTLTLPAGAIAPHTPIALTSARPTAPCVSRRDAALHGLLIASGRARALSAILLPALAKSP